VERLLDEHRPEILTLECALNSNSYTAFPHHHSFPDDYEFEHLAYLAVSLGIPYHCIDGALDESVYPHFTDAEFAARVELPRVRGRYGLYEVSFLDTKLPVAGGRKYWAQCITPTPPEQVIKELPARNEFAADVIRRITKRHAGTRCILHVGGRWHFDDTIQCNGSVYSSLPLQKLVNASRSVVFDAVADKRL